MTIKENAALGDAAKGAGETKSRAAVCVSVSNYITGGQDAKRTLLPMLRLAAHKNWTRILDAQLDLYAAWTQAGGTR